MLLTHIVNTDQLQANGVQKQLNKVYNIT